MMMTTSAAAAAFTLVVVASMVATSAAAFLTSRTFFFAFPSFLFLTTFPIDFVQQEFVERLFTRANVAETFEQFCVMTMLLTR